MKKLMLMLALVGCTDDNTKHMSPTEMCGPPPPAPGFSVAYDACGSGYARLPNDQMLALSDFTNTSYQTWASCIAGIK